MLVSMKEMLADAKAKHYYDNKYGTGQSVWTAIMDTTNLIVAGKTVVAVTSNGIARFSKVLLEDGGVALGGNLKLATGAYGVYVFEDGKWQCEQWNVRPEL